MRSSEPTMLAKKIGKMGARLDQRLQCPAVNS
jgi:hypothetical protein